MSWQLYRSNHCLYIVSASQKTSVLPFLIVWRFAKVQISKLQDWTFRHPNTGTFQSQDSRKHCSWWLLNTVFHHQPYLCMYSKSAALTPITLLVWMHHKEYSKADFSFQVQQRVSTFTWPYLLKSFFDLPLDSLYFTLLWCVNILLGFTMAYNVGSLLLL